MQWKRIYIHMSHSKCGDVTAREGVLGKGDWDWEGRGICWFSSDMGMCI